MNNIHPYSKCRIASNGIEIYYEAFGDPKNPSVLLIMGMDDQCTLWVPYYYEPIVEAGYHVVRFDNRDCGLSHWIDDWDINNPYTLEDMAEDTLGVLDALNVGKAHLIGASMGGMISQRIAISNPDRILTLTSIASSGFPFDPDPAMQPVKISGEVMKIYDDLAVQYPDYQTCATETIEYRMEALRALAGSRFPFDEKLHHRIQTKNILERKGFNPLAQTHHLAAIIASGSRLDDLGQITVPTLVIHGTEDPLLAPAHAIKYASFIPGARLVWMEGVGHELPAGIMELVHREIFNLFSMSNAS